MRRLLALGLLLVGSVAHAQMQGQCTADPVTGISGGLYTSFVNAMHAAGGTLSTLGDEFALAGSNQRKYLCGLLEPIAGEFAGGPAPGGPAGGDLGGVYPIPSVEKIAGATLGSTATTSGHVLVGDGSAWQSVPISGDATLSSGGALSLAASGVTASTYGDASHVGQVALDAKGRATSAAAVAIALDAAAVTSGTLPLTRGGTGTTASPAASGYYLRSSGAGAWGVSTIQSGDLPATAVTAGPYTYASITVGADGRLTAVSSGTSPVTSISTGTGLTGGPITSIGTISLSTPVSAANGGTGATSLASLSAGTGLSYSAGGPFTAATAGTLAVSYGTSSTTATVGNDTRLNPAPSQNGNLVYDTGSAYATVARATTTHQLLHGATGTPTWSAVDLASADVTGLLPDANGGTGIDSSGVTTGQILRASGAGTWAASAVTWPNSITTGDTLVGTGSNAVGVVADVASGSYWRSGGVGAAQGWSTATLPNTVTIGSVLIASATNTLTELTTPGNGHVLMSNASGSAAYWSTPLFGNSAATGDIIAASGTNQYGNNITAVATGQVLSSTGLLTKPGWSKRLDLKGTANVTGDWATFTGWGTGAAVSSPVGDDSHGEIVMTAGTSPSANPVMTLTFKDGSWTTAPRCHAWLNATNDGGVTAPWVTTTTTATTMVVTCHWTPTNPDTYTLDFHCIGIN